MSVWDRFFTVLNHFYRVKIFWRLWWREAMREYSNHSFILSNHSFILSNHSFIYFSYISHYVLTVVHYAVKVSHTLYLAPLPLLVIYTAGSYTSILYVYMCIRCAMSQHTLTCIRSMSSLYISISALIH